jgi:hypothetical protein
MEKLVGDPVDRYSEKTRVGEDDLIVTAGGRVSLKSCPHISAKGGSDIWQFVHEPNGFLSAPFLTLGTGLVVPYAIVSDAEGNLTGEIFEEGGCFLTQVVLEIHPVETFRDKVAGIENPQ